jgi:hypothetical protein
MPTDRSNSLRTTVLVRPQKFSPMKSRSLWGRTPDRREAASLPAIRLRNRPRSYQCGDGLSSGSHFFQAESVAGSSS